LKQYTPAQIKQTLHTQPGVTNAEITKQNSYADISIEQDQHINQPLQQTRDIQDLKNTMKSIFEQTGTMLNLLTTMLTNLNYRVLHPVARNINCK
jgi:membrane-anchored protein YejM (alkaline phosphatase superfamily)